MAVPWELVQRVVVVISVLGGAGVAFFHDDRGLFVRLRHRFVLGVPWGTVVTVLGVLSVYLFLQSGVTHWYSPVVIPFRAWSYLEPLGMLTAGFAHGGPGHLLGNMFGTLALAPIVEYAFGHYPRKRGTSSFEGLRSNPYVRAFVMFPAGVAVAGVGLTLFTLGPVVGFSGVVFAFAGFALVRYPFGTVLALAGSDVLGVAYRALRSPTTTASGRSVYVTPWWSDIAIQGHALGLLAGVVLGALFLERADESAPSPTRARAWVVLVASSVSLWAVYWFRGGDEFVLFRALGASLIAVTAVVITVAVTGSERSVYQRFRRAVTGQRESGTEDSRWSEWTAISTRQVGVAALVLLGAVLAGPAVPGNLLTAEGDVPGDPVSVEGYEVTYAENVTNGMVSMLPVSVFGETTQVPTAGVIVRNEERQIWLTAVSKGQLAHSGRARVVLGGLGWRETVTATRRGWRAIGGDAAYRVRLVGGGENRTAFTSGPAQADLRIDGNNVSVAPQNGTFVLVVENENRTTTTPVPAVNSSVTVENVTFTRESKRITATHNGTRVTVVRKETYN
jgi:membrane associated rhomboid family serine protease